MMVPRPLVDADRLHRRVAHERRAFLHISPDRGDPEIRNAMAAPLLGEAGLIGSMVVANRLTEGTTFSDDDLRLLETLANQAAVALENGQLEQSLAELSRLKEQLRFQAYHDPLTGLANRSLFAEQVNGAIEHPTADRVPVVLFLDLDNFKDVNDALGHPAGDRLLTAVADRVQSCIRAGDVAARLGGDEFAILLLDEPELGSAVTVATRLIAAFAVTFPINGQDLKVSASIGIAASLEQGDQADDLLRNADVAMYTAKQAGKNRFAVFDPTMHAAIVARHAMSTELSHAVDMGEIDVFYQPVLSLATGLTFGVEALARWHHPTRGFVEPDEFIPLAEESGAILALGRAVLFEACREAAPWRSGIGEGISLTVNLSAAQLAQETFVDELTDVLRATGFPASRLVLEMTETVMFADTQTTIARLSALRDLGVRIAVDDFGTGYSSLGYLRRFEVDILKIAREFIAPAATGPDGWAFANAIVALGRSLGLRIIAEGIEEPDQLEHLREMGCEFGQGYLFAKAMPGEEMAERLRPPAVRRVPGRATGAAAAAAPLPPPVQPARLMFLLYAVVIGLALGTLLGGRAAGLAAIRIRWPAAVVGGLLVQVALFSPQVASRVGDLGPPIYVASTLLVGGRRAPQPGAAGHGARRGRRGVQPGGDRRQRRVDAGQRGRGRADGRRAGRARGGLLEQLRRGRSPPVVPDRRVRDAPRAAVRERVQRRRPADRRRDRGRDRARDALGPPDRALAAGAPPTRPTPDRRRRERCGARWCVAEPPTNGRSGQYLWGVRAGIRATLASGMRAQALHRDLRPGQTRREAGTQSQGSSSGDRPVAGAAMPSRQARRSRREGEPGALHLGCGVARVHGPDHRRGHALGLVTKMAPIGVNPIAVVVVAKPARSRPDFGIEAGQRWT